MTCFRLRAPAICLQFLVLYYIDQTHFCMLFSVQKLLFFAQACFFLCKTAFACNGLRTPARVCDLPAFFACNCLYTYVQACASLCKSVHDLCTPARVCASLCKPVQICASLQCLCTSVQCHLRLRFYLQLSAILRATVPDVLLLPALIRCRQVILSCFYAQANRRRAQACTDARRQIAGVRRQLQVIICKIMTCARLRVSVHACACLCKSVQMQTCTDLHRHAQACTDMYR